MFSEADRLDMVKALGAEEFDTGQASTLWGVLEGEYNEPELTGIAIEGEIRWIEARLSDVQAHSLVRDSRLVQVATGAEFFVKSFEPSKSSGFVVIRLKT